MSTDPILYTRRYSITSEYGGATVFVNLNGEFVLLRSPASDKHSMTVAQWRDFVQNVEALITLGMREYLYAYGYASITDAFDPFGDTPTPPKEKGPA
jgi:hypothetical protein